MTNKRTLTAESFYHVHFLHQPPNHSYRHLPYYLPLLHLIKIEMTIQHLRMDNHLTTQKIQVEHPHLHEKHICAHPHTHFQQGPSQTIHESRDPLKPGNYQPVIIFYTFIKRYRVVLDVELNSFSTNEEIWALGQAGFRKQECKVNTSSMWKENLLLSSHTFTIGLTTQDYKTNTSSMQKTHFLLTSHIFNRALVGGLASTCKTTPPTRELSNNHVYTFTKYCRAVLDAELNSSSKVEEIWGLDQARFRKAFSTTDILKLGCLVDQVKAQKKDSLAALRIFYKI